MDIPLRYGMLTAEEQEQVCLQCQDLVADGQMAAWEIMAGFYIRDETGQPQYVENWRVH